MSKLCYFASSALLVLAGLGTARAEDKAPVPRDPRLVARDQEATHMLMLRQWNDARQQQIRALSNLQASHHETMMVIIDNMRPAGRYEYNPSTGRYDRYVPYPRR